MKSILNTKSIALKVNERFYYGWVIVAVAGISMVFTSPGQTYSISAFIDVYIEEFGFSRTTISTIYSIATLLSGLLMVGMGKMVDKFGQKVMLIVSGVMLALVTLFNSFVFTIPMLAIGFFSARYFGQGALNLIPGTLIPQWFKAKRGQAMSIAKLGIYIAGVAVPLMNVYMISNYGWQSTWRLWSILVVIFFIPLVLLLVVNTPEEIGLKPDNIALKEEEIEEEALEVEANSWHVTEAIKTKTFWQLGSLAMVGPLVSTGLMFHFYSILGERGLTATEAAIALGLMGIPGFFFSLVSGYLVDRIVPQKILALGLAIMGMGIIVLAFSTHLVVAVIAVLIYGSGQATYFVAVGVMWPNFFGRKYLGSIQGVATFFMVIGSALGPFPFALSFDIFYTYNPVLIFAIILITCGCFIALHIKVPVRK